MEIRQAYGPAFIRGKAAHEEVGRELQHQMETFSPGLCRQVLGALLLLHDLDPVFFREVSQRLGIGHVLVLHQEADCCALLVTAETVVHAPGGVHVERRRLLLMEGTAGNEIGAAPAQGYEIPHDVNYLRRVQYPFFRVPGNHLKLTEYAAVRSTTESERKVVRVCR